MPTLLARPAELSRIGYAVPDHLAALTPPVVPSVELGDGTITGTLSWALSTFRSGEEPAGTAPQSPSGIPGGDLSVAPEPLEVGITVTTPDGKSLDRDLGEVAQTAKGQVPIDAKVLCPDGCRLAGLWLRGTDQFTDLIAGHLDLTDLELDGAPLDIGDGASWLPVETPTTEGTQELSGAGNDLGVEFTNTGRRVLSRWGDVPDPTPVVLAGPPPADADGDDFTLVGLGGRPVASRAVQHVDALPALTDHGALSDLDAQLRVGGEAGAGSALQVWLGTESPAVIREVSAALTAAGAAGHVDHHGHRDPRPVRPLRDRLGAAARRVHRRDGAARVVPRRRAGRGHLVAWRGPRPRRPPGRRHPESRAPVGGAP